MVRTERNVTTRRGEGELRDGGGGEGEKEGEEPGIWRGG